MADRIRLYTCQFTTRNQVIKTPEKVDQVIKQVPMDESNYQAPILMIKFLDHRCRYISTGHIVVTTPCYYKNLKIVSWPK